MKIKKLCFLLFFLPCLVLKSEPNGMVKIITTNDTDFFMDINPITYKDFKIYVEEGGEKNAYWKYSSYNIDNQPVSGISWYHAIDYCNWRSFNEGLEPAYIKSDSFDYYGYEKWIFKPKSNGYRLPTKDQFIYAAKSGKDFRIYPWGNFFKDSLANYDTDKGDKNSKWWRLAPVNSQFKNDWGLNGMTGNIWHWCNDNFNIYNENIKRTKALFGGSWGSIDSNDLMINHLSHSSPNNYNYDIGFRCILPVGKLDSRILENAKPTYDFYKKPKLYDLNINNVFKKISFINRLEIYLSDNYPKCINFISKIDQQEIISPKEMSETIIRVSNDFKINPLFLCSIMISESGFGTVSFPRWWNNPMAYHWQNKLMVNGLPVYEDLPGKRNRKFKTLNDAFEAFCKGIRREVYFNASKKNLYDFHMIYVGYKAKEWMYTISRVFMDVNSEIFNPNYPSKECGNIIYLDWKEITSTSK